MSKFIVPIYKGIVTGNMHMKHKSPINYHSKDMAKVNVFKKWVKLQGHKVKNYGAIRFKVLLIRITHMIYESPITCHSKDMANVKVFEKWVKLQDQGQKLWYQ